MRFKIDIAVISEARWLGEGEDVVKSSAADDKFKIFYSGGSAHENGVAFLIKISYTSSVLSFEPISDRLATLQLKGVVPITIIAVYAPTEPASPALKDQFYHSLQNVIN